MKANELRAGNLIYNDRVMNVVTMIGVDSVQLTTRQGNLIGARTELIEPIPLTEEILLKCGFEIFPWGYVRKSSNDFGVRLNLRTFSYEVSGNNSVKVQCLHQLQNLIHALTGEELNIKL